MENGLPVLPEDTYEVCKNMRASSPPASATDLIEQQMPRRYGGARGKRVGGSTQWTRFYYWQIESSDKTIYERYKVWGKHFQDNKNCNILIVAFVAYL